MAGLDPAIHVLLFQSRTKKDVNAQDTLARKRASARA
jgi:hypothetical protein